MYRRGIHATSKCGNLGARVRNSSLPFAPALQAMPSRAGHLRPRAAGSGTQCAYRGVTSRIAERQAVRTATTSGGSMLSLLSPS